MIEGGCHCGAVRYTVIAHPTRHALCHCTDCRRSSGAPAVAWAIFKRDDVQLTKGQPKVRSSSEHGRRSFCGACGTGLLYENDLILPGLIDVQSATLDDPGAIAAPDVQVQLADRIGWMVAVQAIPGFERYPPKT